MVRVPAAEFTMGVEEEYQLIDGETGALRSHATAIRHEDWTGELFPELQETTVEIGTPICNSAAEAQEQLRRLRFQAGTVAAAHGLTIVSAGTHPFSDWRGHERPPLERYRGIEEHYGRIARDEHIFGMHVHIAVPAGTDRLGIGNAIRHYLPHLLALSASSPFIDGEDTGYASYRTILWRRWPNSGVPPRFLDEAAFQRYTDMLLAAGVMRDRYNLYWSMRPHPEYPTIEFRVMDACPSLRDAGALGALARAIVYAAVTGVIRDEAPAHFGVTSEQELLRINEWCAARHGLGARWIDSLTARGDVPMTDAIARLLEHIAPSFEELGDVAALAHLEEMLERGSAADHMRRVHGDGNMKDLMNWLVEETLTGTGLDRRGAARSDT